MLALLMSAAALISPRVSLAQDQEPLRANQFRFEHQLRVNPFDPAALNNLAVVKAAQGRYADARDLLERAARLAPLNSEIRANLGRLAAWESSVSGAASPQRPPELETFRPPPEPPPLWE